MILRSIRVEGLGCFADAFTAGPFTPGINLLCAPNATGKSTLFRAMSLGFIEPHRGRSSEVQALRPWGRHLTPQVSIEFEHAGRIYRVRKRFLDSPSAQIEMREGDNWTSFAQGDHADEFLRELLQTTSDKPRSAKREHWGLAQVLWTTQGDLTLPPLASSVIESIRGSVGAQLAARDSAISARVNKEYEQFFSPKAGRLKSGRNATPQIRFEAERDRLAGELETAEELLRQFEVESGHIEQVRLTAAAAMSRRAMLAEEAERIRADVELYAKLRSEQRERTVARDAAQQRHKSMRERIESIERARQQVQECEQSLAAITAELPALGAELQERQKVAAEADKDCAAATAAEAHARAELDTARAAEEYVQAVAGRYDIAKRLDTLAAAQIELGSALERRALVHAPSESEVSDLRALLAHQTDARRRLELARISVAFTPEADLALEVIAGEHQGILSCRAGVPVVLGGSPNLEFSIPEVGRFEARGPVSDYGPIRKELAQHETAIAEFTTQFGTADPEVLSARRQQAAAIDADIQQARHTISLLLAGESEITLREMLAQLAGRIAAITTHHPEWVADAPDCVTMVRSANAQLAASAESRNRAEAVVREARDRLAETEQRLSSAESRRAALVEGLDRARQMLADCVNDGLTDEQRQARLDEAAVDYDGCRIALARVETELSRFAEDPSVRASLLKTQMAAAETEANEAKEELLRAETRIQGLVDRRPYAAISEAAERLTIVRDQLEREQRRMDALSLLHRMLDEAQAEMMAAVAAPVERIATDYLEEICSRPVAEIRLTQELAAERVIPVALAEDDDPAVDVDRLSGGEREQIFFCTRLALGSELARRERQTVVLDDVLTSTDAERMERVFRLLGAVSDRLQVIILTCHPERFAGLRSANLIDLAAALGNRARAALQN